MAENERAALTFYWDRRYFTGKVVVGRVTFGGPGVKREGNTTEL